MNFDKNEIYLVSLQSFSYHVEGYVANEEGTIPLKAFKKEDAAKDFALTFFRKQFTQDIDSVLEVLINERMHENNFLVIQEVVGDQCAKYFQVLRNGQYSYYQLIDNKKVRVAFKNQLIKVCSEEGLEKVQNLYRVIIGVNLIHIEKIEYD